MHTSNPVFLAAEWRKLLMFNYEVDPKILEAHVPKGTELDSFDGKHYISVVGFMFEETKVKGIKIPFHVKFEEVNLRFYVKYYKNGVWRRGVVFIKEIVPKFFISLIANWLYNEKYVSLKMDHSITEGNETLGVNYLWEDDTHAYSMSAKASKQGVPLVKGSVEEFITEHYWGYGESSSGNLIEYEVKHPSWDTYPVLEYSLEGDFSCLYGEEFGKIIKGTPSSVLLAEGSEISVHTPEIYS